jgi:uncharacterized membrane protein (UPF0127 family)
MKIKVHTAKTFYERCIGLIGRTPTPLLLQTRFGIHTWFMKDPIDVLILDKNKTVVQIKENLKPWSIWMWSPQFFLCIETPAGFIKKNKIKYKTKVNIIPK